MSALRISLLLAAVSLIVAGCAYDPKISAQYALDGQGGPIIGPQLPLRGNPSAHDLNVQRKREADPTTNPSLNKDKPKSPTVTTSAPEKTVSTKSTDTSLPPNANASVNEELTLPKPDNGTNSAAIAPATPGQMEVKVEEKIPTDVAVPTITVETQPPPAATDPTATPAPTPAPSAPEPAPAAAPATTAAAPAASQSNAEQIVVVETNLGRITIELDELAAPLTVTNFKKLAGEGYYNGTTFHRVIPDFMVQGGDPNSKGEDRAIYGKGGPDYTLQAEIKLKHKRGSVAMARLPNNVNPLKSSNGSQFYICVIDCPFLDGEYTVFGKVTSGMEVVDRISTQQRDARDNPLQRIEMKVSLEPKPMLAVPEKSAAVPAEAPADRP